MKPTYTPDNTRSSIVVILLLAAGVSIVALLTGLSEKPQVSAIGISTAAAADGGGGGTGTTSDPLGSTLAPGTESTEPVAAATLELDEAGNPIVDDAVTAAATADTAALPAAGIDATPTATAIPIPTPEPTAEVAPAVEPTADPLAASAESTEDDLGLRAVEPGVVTGQFFTRPDEDEGAIVTRNELTLTLAEDGTGSFSGVLEMTLFDQTRVELAMSGPIRWSNGTPQVTADLSGTYELDSPIDADDVSSTDAELTISSLGSGSGSLCADTCFGFTFTPQSGL